MDFGTAAGLITLIITLLVTLERLMSKVNIALQLCLRIVSQIESAFADTGGFSEFLTSSVVSTERTSPTPLDKGAKGTDHGVSP